MKLAEKGALISVVDLVEQAGQETVQQIEAAGGKAIFVKADVSIAAEVGTALLPNPPATPTQLKVLILLWWHYPIIYIYYLADLSLSIKFNN